ncbi:MAG: amidohydrolase family protein [Balneolales bacterium]
MKRIPILYLLPVLVFFAGCGEDYYTVDDFLSVEKIDTHVHIDTPHPIMVEQAIQDNFRLSLVNRDNPAIPFRYQREVAIDLKNQYPDEVSFLTTFTMEGWEDPDWVENTIDYLEDSFSKGAIGVKIWKNIGMVEKDENGEFIMVDHPQLDPIFEYLAENGKPVLGHIGEPKNCWLPLEEMTVNNDRDYFENNPQYHMYLHPEYPSYEEIIEARNNMLDKHPDLVFIGAHLASLEWSVEEMSEHLDKYPNLALDMAHRVSHLQYLTQQDREKVRDFFIKYQDRFVYSTDLAHREGEDPVEVQQLVRDTWRADWEFFVTDNTLEVWQVDGAFQGLKLPKVVVDKLFRINPETWYPGI